MPLYLPTTAERGIIKTVHETLYEPGALQDIPSLVSTLGPMMDFPGFPKLLVETGFQVQDNESVMRLPFMFFQYLLQRRDYVSSALLLWSEDTFNPDPHFVQLVWGALFDGHKINAMGAGSTSKTFGASVWMFLDWLLDPEWTRIEVASNSEDHAKRNIFAGLTRLHMDALLPLPGICDSESISTDKTRGMGIFLMTLPGGPVPRGKVKGAKLVSRPNHPTFGTQSRLRFIVDEAQEAPPSIFQEIPNLVSSIQGHEHIKIFMAANPSKPLSEYGRNCTPRGGWEGHDMDLEKWKSENGWDVLRFNAMKCENVIAGKVLFKGLITRQGVDEIIQAQGGDDQSPVVWTLVYGMFPLKGALSDIVKMEHVRRSQGEWIFDTMPEVYAGGDCAFNGDLKTYAVGRVGRAIGWKDESGEKFDLDAPKYALQIDLVTVLPPHGDLVDLAGEFMDRARGLMMRPEHFAIDRTGLGQGVHDLVSRQWYTRVDGVQASDKKAQEAAPILGVNYSEGASESRICEEDTLAPCDMYDSIIGEMWYAAGKLFEFDSIRVGRGVDLQTVRELTSRRGGIKGKKKMGVESKKEYKARTGMPSPDRADALTLLVHAARMGCADLAPKARQTVTVGQHKIKWPFEDDADELDGDAVKYADPSDMGGFKLTEHEMNLQVD